jgi:hypothetical protein
MKMNAEIEVPEKAVCGQAHAVFNILARTGSLPAELSLSIEEILERAWEIAYRRRQEIGMAPVSDLANYRALREAGKRSGQSRVGCESQL